MNISKIPASWLIIIGFALIIGSGYWFWVDDIKPFFDSDKIVQTVVNESEKSTGLNPVDVSKWKTYRNEKYGFEIKYPDYYSVDEEDEKSWICFSNQSCISGTPFLNIIIGENPKKLSAEQWWITNKLNEQGFIKKGNIQIGDYDAFEFKESPMKYPMSDIIIAHGDKVILLSGGVVEYDSMIKSFKFIEPVSELDTFDWKTYRNEKYGFEVKYPADWELSESNLESARPSVALEKILGPQWFVIYINFEPNPKRFNVEDYVASVLAGSHKAVRESGIGVDLSQYQPIYITIGNKIEAYELKGVFQFDQSVESIYFTKNFVAYHILFPIAEENPNLLNPIENNEIAHQILSTFRFIK